MALLISAMTLVFSASALLISVIGLLFSASALLYYTVQYPRMKISVSTDISVRGFYGCIGYIEDISVDIFT